MIDAIRQYNLVRHKRFSPGGFSASWHDAAYQLHCNAWPSPWEGQLTLDRFIAEMKSDHVDTLYQTDGRTGEERLLAYVKWKTTSKFYTSRDQLSDPAQVSLSAASTVRYVCAYEITATNDPVYRRLGTRLLGEAIDHWTRTYRKAVFCTYSPKRKLTAVLRRLAACRQDDRSLLQVFADRVRSVASRRIYQWTARLDESLESFLQREIVSIPDEHIMGHLISLKDRFGGDLIDGLVAAIGVAVNFVYRAKTGRLACAPAAFHRTLGAEHWRQYPFSAMNCADALGLVDHWRYSADPTRREECAELFRCQRAARIQRTAGAEDLIVLS
jgi:hypothetical protein